MIHLSVFSSLFLAPLQPDPGAPVKYVKLKITHMGLFGVSQKVLRHVCYTFNRRHSFDRSYHQIFVKKHVWSDFVWFFFFFCFSQTKLWSWLKSKQVVVTWCKEFYKQGILRWKQLWWKLRLGWRICREAVWLFSEISLICPTTFWHSLLHDKCDQPSNIL